MDQTAPESLKKQPGRDAWQMAETPLLKRNPLNSDRSIAGKPSWAIMVNHKELWTKVINLLPFLRLQYSKIQSKGCLFKQQNQCLHFSNDMILVHSFNVDFVNIDTPEKS